jgi:hypothetical protein
MNFGTIGISRVLVNKQNVHNRTIMGQFEHAEAIEPLASE